MSPGQGGWVDQLGTGESLQLPGQRIEISWQAPCSIKDPVFKDNLGNQRRATHKLYLWPLYPHLPTYEQHIHTRVTKIGVSCPHAGPASLYSVQATTTKAGLFRPLILSLPHLFALDSIPT